jgi:hypothetical protein
MMNKIIIGVCAFAVVLGLGLGIVAKIRADAVTVERAKVAAKANQTIAERRAKDAKFDKMDAQQHCIAGGLEWVFEDGRSFCR